MLVIKMFQKKRISISFWYLVSVIVMTILYFLFSDKLLTSREFREAIAGYLAALDWIPPVEYNWGIPVLAGLIIYWGLIFVFRDD